MNKLHLMIAMQNPDLLPILILLDDEEEVDPVDEEIVLDQIDIDTSTIDFSTAEILIPITGTVPVDTSLESVQVSVTSANYNGVIYNDGSNDYVKVTRVTNEVSAAEIRLFSGGVNVLNDVNTGFNVVTFTHDGS